MDLKTQHSLWLSSWFFSSVSFRGWSSTSPAYTVLAPPAVHVVNDLAQPREFLDTQWIERTNSATSLGQGLWYKGIAYILYICFLSWCLFMLIIYVNVYHISHPVLIQPLSRGNHSNTSQALSHPVTTMKM